METRACGFIARLGLFLPRDRVTAALVQQLALTVLPLLRQHQGQAMDQSTNWRDRFLRHAGDVRDAFLVFQEAHTHLLSVFLSANFEVASGAHAGGLLIELGVHNESRAFAAVGATFSKNADVLYVSHGLIRFSYEVDQGGGRLLFSGENKLLSESTEGWIQYATHAGTFRLTDLKAALLFWDHRQDGYAPVKQWNLADYQSVNFAVLCSGCFGEGQSKQMSISQEDYASGLSGYALYSCNQINGTYGCQECGGAGARYEPWYLAENPGLQAGSEPFRKGSGLIPQRNLTAVQIRVPGL